MERLTDKSPCLNCNSDRQIGNPNVWQTDCYRCEKMPNWKSMVIDRLSKIEDVLGDNYDINRLKELVQADREGRCVVLQYKKNDVAYSIKHNPFIRKVVVRQMLVDTDNGIVWYHCIDDLWDPDFFVSCDIGKTVFRTREEAESALKAMKEREEND